MICLAWGNDRGKEGEEGKEGRKGNLYVFGWKERKKNREEKLILCIIVLSSGEEK
jgi:hypothetical protein